MSNQCNIRNQTAIPSDADVEMMEVEHLDPSSLSMEESFSNLPAMKSPVSAGAQSISSNNSEMGNGTKKRRTKVQSFNRSNVHIEDYILKDPDNINAKAMRVLLPAMYQKLRHPDKETTKTKVKGLWEIGSKPMDFPVDVDFKDPNNAKKMSNEMMKKFFVYLKKKLLANHPQYTYRTVTKYWHNDANQTGPSGVPEQEPVAYPTKNVPNLEPFQVLNEGHDARKSFVPQNEQAIQQILYEVKPECTLNEAVFTGGTMIPRTVEQISSVKEEEDTSAYMGFGVQENINSKESQLLVQYAVPDSTLSQQDQMLMPQPQSAIAVPCHSYTSQDHEGNVVTDLTILHKMQVAETPETITMMEEPISRQPVNPQEVSESDPDSTQNAECAKFVADMRSELMPIVRNFGTMFCDNQDVIRLTYALLDDVFKPMFEIASQGNREKALEMSEFCTYLGGILKRSLFLGSNVSPLEQLVELKHQFGDMCMGSIVPESSLPPVDNEVQVFNAVTTTQPNFMLSGRDPYIPTIASIKSRAERKQQEIEGVDSEPVYGTWQDQKVLVEKDPFPESILSPMTKDMADICLDAEQDFGISLKRSESYEDAEDPKYELDRFIEKELIRKQAEKSSFHGQTSNAEFVASNQEQVAQTAFMQPTAQTGEDNEDQAITDTLRQAYTQFGCEFKDISVMLHVYGLDGTDPDLQTNNVACSDQLRSNLEAVPKMTVPALQNAGSLLPTVLDPGNGALGQVPYIPTTVLEKAASADDDDGPKAKRRARGKGVSSRGKGYKRLPTHGKGKHM